LPKLYVGIKSNKIQYLSKKSKPKVNENIPISNFISKSGWSAINHAYETWVNNNSFLTVGIPSGKFTHDGIEYNSYFGYILSKYNTVFDLSKAGRTTTNETLTYKNLHFFQTHFNLNTDISPLISPNNFGIGYGINRAYVMVGFVIYVYDNSTIRLKLFLYDIFKPLDSSGKQILTFNESNTITIMSNSELTNKTNNLKLSDLLTGVNQNGLRYIYINDPVLTSFVADPFAIYDWNYNYYIWLKIQTEKKSD